MKSPRARLAVLSTMLLASSFLSACGYTPLYIPQDGGTRAATRVQIGPIEMEKTAIEPGQRRVAQLVSQRLRRDFPKNAAQMDTVSVEIKENSYDLAVQSTATVERVQLELLGTLTVTTPDGKPRLRTTVVSRAPYNVVNTPYSTESGKTFARQTAANVLAEEISRRLTMLYRQKDVAEQLSTDVTAPEDASTAPILSPAGGLRSKTGTGSATGL